MTVAQQNPATLDLSIEPTHDERALMKYISQLRKFVQIDLSESMKQTYDHKVKPAYIARHGEAPKNGVAVRRAMRPELVYSNYSAMRYIAQEMVWASVMPAIERKAERLNAEARKSWEQPAPTGGTLRLNPALDMPDNVTAVDIHLMPGCYQEDRGSDDVSQGALYQYGTEVFSGGLVKGRQHGDVAASVARFLKTRYPDFKPKRILDMGCTTGRNTLPFAIAYPEAEVHGVDLGASLLKFAHARAVSLGIPAHFSQQDATHMDFEDGSFDLIFSSFFLHEISVKQTRAVFRECRRLLRPGGMMLNMELPPSSKVDEYMNFWFDWDAYYNNEPHYSACRNMDPVKELVDAGFTAEDYVEHRVPNLSITPEAEFDAVARGEKEETRLGNFLSYYVNGARLSA